MLAITVILNLSFCLLVVFGYFLSNCWPSKSHLLIKFLILLDHVQFSLNYCRGSFQLKWIRQYVHLQLRRFQNDFYCFDYHSYLAISLDQHFTNLVGLQHEASWEASMNQLERVLSNPFDLNCSNQCYFFAIESRLVNLSFLFVTIIHFWVCFYSSLKLQSY